MAYNNFCPDNCPVNCADLLAVVPSLPACETVSNDKITELFWSKSPLSTGDLSEWNTRLSNSATTATSIRSLVVEANMPRVDAAFKTSQKGTMVPLEVERVVGFNIEEDSDNYFNWLQELQCGQIARFWWRSGKHIYGGMSGVYGAMVSNFEINDQAELMAHNWDMQVRFKSKCTPPRTLAVI